MEAPAAAGAKASSAKAAMSRSRAGMRPANRPSAGASSSRTDEAVAHAGLRDQVLRPRRFRLELAAQLRHVDAQVVRLRLVLRSPPLLQQLALAHEPALVAGEHLEQVPLRWR